MLSSILPILLAIVALSAIIFIHEMGHLLAALFVKMKVNTFSIGFGPAIKSWKWRDIEWRISWVPLGGYVSIQGLDDGETGPGSYYSVSVLKRIFVIAMGPLVNIALAWLLFAGIYAGGGMEKPFTEVTTIAGWIDPSSELAQFVKPGDHIEGYDGRKLSSSKDHLYLPLLAQGEITVDFESIDYASQTRKEAHAKVKPYSHPEAADASFKTAGIFSGAKWLIVEGFSEKSKGLARSLADSGALEGDRLVAVNGERLFSDRHLNFVLNTPYVWVGIQRGEQKFNTKLPLISLSDLSNTSIQLEWRDWLFSMETSLPLLERKCLPLNLSLDSIVESIDSQESFNLKKGDKLLSINGVAFQSSKELCTLLQNPPASVILYRGSSVSRPSFEDAQNEMYTLFSSPDLQALLHSPLTDQVEEKGSFIRLAPVTLMPFEMLAMDQLKKWRQNAQLIVEESARDRMLKLIDDKAKEKVLGVRLQDQIVYFNPPANVLMVSAVKQIGSALNALLNGQLSLKWMAGPVGMVTVVTQGFSVGLKQACYWLAMISLNLGLFNLLPLPMFDGGRIVIEMLEAVTRRRIPTQVMEFLTYALFVGLIALSLVATYWDIWRLASLWNS